MDGIKFGAVTVGLVIGLGVAFAAAFRTAIAADWENRRCDPGVVPIAGIMKPADDPRSRAQFAADNWKHCQKDYIQAALRTATAAPQALAAAQADTVGVVDDMTRDLTDLFVDLWGFCYEAYSTFMEKIRGVAKLFHNQLIKIHEIAGRMNAAITSLIFGLISMIVAFISSVQLVIIIVIIIVGIMLVLQILLWFLFMPISGLILTISAMVMAIAVVVATTVAAVTVGEMFQTGACFVAGTPVAIPGGGTVPIERVELGQRLGDGGIVTAVHRFVGADQLFDLFGVRVTGDHLVWAPGAPPGRLIPVAQHPAAIPVPRTLTESLLGPTTRELWCLTTSSRTIPVMSPQEGHGWVIFADWEEIPASEMEQLRDWHAEVWQTLNGADCPVERPTMAALTSEAALSADCRVAVQGVSWQFLGSTAPAHHWVSVADVQPGDRIATNMSLTEFTSVVGVVQLSADQVTRAMTLPGATGYVSAGTWIATGTGVDALWCPADSPLRPAGTAGTAIMGAGATGTSWHHLYTASGTVLIEGGRRVRDASDVGLEGLAPLVGRTVLSQPVPLGEPCKQSPR